MSFKNEQEVVFFNENSFACLSQNRYFVYFIRNGEVQHRIESEEKIIFFTQLTTKVVSVGQPQKHSKRFKGDYVVFIANKKLEWAIYGFGRNGSSQPKIVSSGSIVLSNSDLVQNQSKTHQTKIICIHQLRGGLMVVLSNLQVHMIQVDSKKADHSQHQGFPPLKAKSMCLIDLKKSANFLLPQMMPSIETAFLTKCLIKSSESHAAEEKGQIEILLTFQETGNEAAKGTENLYSLMLDLDEKTARAGKTIAIGLRGNTLGIFQLTPLKVIIQTTEMVYLLKQTHEKESQKEELLGFEYKFTGCLCRFQSQSKSTHNNQLCGILSQGQSQFNSKLYNVVLISSDDKLGLSFEILDTISFIKVRPLLIHLSSDRSIRNSLFFLADYSLVTTQGQGHGQKLLFADLQSKVMSARIHTDFHGLQNLISIKKTLSLSVQQKSQCKELIISKQWVELDNQMYYHNLQLGNCRMISQKKSQNRPRVLLSNCVIGALQISLSCQGGSLENESKTQKSIKIKTKIQQKATSQILCISTCGSITVQPGRIHLLNHEFSVSSLFEGTIQMVRFACLLESASVLILGVDEQLHFYSYDFKARSKKDSLKRNFIHCFDCGIKEVLCLNDVNVVMVELFPDLNDQMNDQAAKDNQNRTKNLRENFTLLKVKNDSVETVDMMGLCQKSLHQTASSLRYGHRVLQFLIHLNTVPFMVTIKSGIVFLISSEEMQRFNSEKTQIHISELSLPIILNNQGSKTHIELTPILCSQSSETKVEFIVQIMHLGRMSFFYAQIPKKNLLKGHHELSISYQKLILTEGEGVMIDKSKKRSSMLFGQKFQVSMTAINPQVKVQFLALMTQKELIVFTFARGTIDSQIGEKFQKGFDQIQQKFFKDQQMVPKCNIVTKQQHNSEENKNDHLINDSMLKKSKCLSTSKNDEAILFNEFEVWHCKEIGNKYVLDSVYTLVNNEFSEFRNNLSIEELDDVEFMDLFSSKLPILQVKYLNNRAVLVLYEKSLMVLEIRENGALSLRQEINFGKIKGGEGEEVALYEGGIIQQEHLSNNEYSQVRICELLDAYDEQNMFLKDAEQRLYKMEVDRKTDKYKIVFDRNLEEDITCIGRLSGWSETTLNLPLLKNKSLERAWSYQKGSEEIVIKKDGQMVVKNLKTCKETSHYV